MIDSDLIMFDHCSNVPVILYFLYLMMMTVRTPAKVTLKSNSFLVRLELIRNLLDEVGPAQTLMNRSCNVAATLVYHF